MSLAQQLYHGCRVLVVGSTRVSPEQRRRYQGQRLGREVLMKLTVKTLQGGKFQVDVEESTTVAELKTVIVRVVVLRCVPLC